ncbi:Uncharacterised protein [Lederbergia lenta]|uniref:Uncharacterized protein n=1 Tax=Lederbergia lenta TaxID=1467 RepID=A0A2X4ZDP3_LEDLE|nr:Uncharacterised protein [Lederbergia lenta]
MFYTYFGTWNQAKITIFGSESPSLVRETNKNHKNRSHFTKYDLMTIAKENIEFFTTIKVWNDFAMKNGLPWAGTFANYFGTWNKVKIVLVKT